MDRRPFDDGPAAAPLQPLRPPIGGTDQRLRAPDFEPTGSPPPPLLRTCWLRVLSVTMPLVSIASMLWWSYRDTVVHAMEAPLVVGLHAAAVGAPIVWSVITMSNADMMIPATRYGSRARGWVAAVLGFVAVAAITAGVALWEPSRTWLKDPNDPNVVVVHAGLALGVAVLVWLPFRYLCQQAVRLGVSRRAIRQWYWLPILGLGGALLILRLGLRDHLAGNGVTAAERVVEVAVVHGLPVLLFALTGWRATGAMDATIRFRWDRRWADWEHERIALGPALERPRTPRRAATESLTASAARPSPRPRARRAWPGPRR